MQLHHRFIQTAKKFGKKIAVYDIATGKDVTYEKMLIASLIFASKFKKIKTKYVGVMVPTSAGCMLTKLGLLMAGKIPVMINYATGAIENSKVFEDALIKAHTDSLTGLWNYGYFQYKLDEEIMKAKNQKYNLSVMMMDIDDFKKFNDTFGHPAGDEVLKRIAFILKDNSRKIDIVARYGGEEFALILPYTNKEEAKIMDKKFDNGQSFLHAPTLACFCLELADYFFIRIYKNYLHQNLVSKLVAFSLVCAGQTIACFIEIIIIVGERSNVNETLDEVIRYFSKNSKRSNTGYDRRVCLTNFIKHEFNFFCLD